MKQRLRQTLNETLRSLQIRNFRLFFGGQLVSQIGNWVTLVAQSLLVLHLAHLRRLLERRRPLCDDTDHAY